MSYYFIPFDQYGYQSNFLVQGSCRCELPELIHTIDGKRIDTLTICEMHNHSEEYHNTGECLSLAIVDDSVIKITATINNPNTILKIQEGVLIGFSIKFDSDQQRIVEIALIDTPTFQDEDLKESKEFIEAITWRRLLYLWTLRAKGFLVNNEEIEKLELEIYPDLQESIGIIERPLCQRDVDELQLQLSLVEPQTNDGASFTKALLFRLFDIAVKMRKEGNHQRPHFHVEYKHQYSASYAVDTLERLAGNVPPRYEKPILEWAAKNRDSLKLTWDKLQAGEDVRDLVSDAKTA